MPPTDRRPPRQDAVEQRSLWRSAAWTGVGAALVCAIVSLIAVAICWLPVSGETAATSSNTDHASSTIRAGLLTFLASLHGGVTVDASHVSWLPLGLTLLVGLVAWRAGANLAAVADELGEDDPGRLARAALAQAGAFTAAALAMVHFAELGTSHVSYGAVLVSAFLLFAVSGGSAFVRDSPLRAHLVDRAPARLGPVLRAACAALCVYLLASALLVGASLVVHHDRVEAISAQVGDGWGGIPVLLLGLLAAPNAVLAGTSYLAGPGFALGTGTHVHLFGAAHGVLPAFPPLAAVPTGAANPIAITAAVATMLLAGIVAARVAARAEGWAERLGQVIGAAVTLGVLLFVLGWQSGGAIGDGRLHAIGPSPWQLAAAATLEVLVVGCAGQAALAAWQWVRSPIDEEDGVGFLLSPRRLSAVRDEDEDGRRQPTEPVKLTKRAG